MEAKALAELLLLLQEQLSTIQKQMKSITENHSLGDTFQSLPGAGDLLSCKLLAIFGDKKERYTSANGVQCLFETAPKNYQSGTYHKVTMRYACNKEARSILYKFSFASLRRSSWAFDYYNKQRERGKTHSVALRALSNKWVKIIFKLWLDEIIYDEKKKTPTAA